MSDELEHELRSVLLQAAAEVESAPPPPLANVMGTSAPPLQVLEQRSRERLTGRAAACVALVAIGIGAIVVVGRAITDDSTSTMDPTSTWQPVPAPPEPWASGTVPSVVAAGDRLVFLGRTATHSSVAQVLDTTTKTWSTPSIATPLGDDKNSEPGVWTGSVVVYRGATFDPVTQHWSGTSSNERDPNYRFWWGVWDGSEAVFMPGGRAYNPSTNSWRTLADLPSDLRGLNPVWTGSQLISATYLGDAWWSYDPSTERWTQLPSDGAPSGMPMSAAWTSSGMVVTGPARQAHVFDPITSTWRDLPDVPLRSCPEQTAQDDVQVVAGSVIVPSRCEPKLAVLTGEHWSIVAYPTADEDPAECEFAATSTRLYSSCINSLYVPPQAVLVPKTSTTTAAARAPALHHAIDLNAQTLFGFAVGDLEPEQVTTALADVLGPPTRDTGWYVTPRAQNPDGDCLGGNDQRVLRWRNVSYAFWRLGNGTSTLWSWVVGNEDASSWGDRKEPYPIVSTPAIGVSTSDGIAVGTPVTTAQNLLGDRLRNPDASGLARLETDAAHPYVDGQGHVSMSVDNGLITGIGSTLAFC